MEQQMMRYAQKLYSICFWIANFGSLIRLQGILRK